MSRRRFGDDADDVALFTGQPVPITFPTPPADNFTDIEALAPLSTARSSRRAARERRASADDGAGTDDELEPDGAADLSAAVARLREGLAGLFGDVRADDFRDPNLGIRRKFEEWRAKFPEEYANAFGGLAMVGVWEFWARVEMGLWNPFEVSATRGECFGHLEGVVDDWICGVGRSSSWREPRLGWTGISGTPTFPRLGTRTPTTNKTATPNSRTSPRQS